MLNEVEDLVFELKIHVLLRKKTKEISASPFRRAYHFQARFFVSRTCQLNVGAEWRLKTLYKTYIYSWNMTFQSSWLRHHCCLF